MSDPNVYTVGWICAISTEYTAARQFLDKQHDPPDNLPPHTQNTYTLGEIGKHNVVITVLPEYGTSSAANAARDMLSSFPNVRVGLMVGIGGGAPSKDHDIRLGDVVVSASRDGNASVLQYDFGKTMQGERFKPTGYLNLPPPLLQSTVQGLKTVYDEEGNSFDSMIEKVLKKRPRLQAKFKKPDSVSDQLYVSDYIHQQPGVDCAEACGSDSSALIRRRERSEYEDNPAVHYGLIASANQVMKDAVVRDRLAKENGVLCFEMEAAGLMNHFPCLVIRGICDYSDSHKHKQWQGYAAMTAAAYARDLLMQITPLQVEKSERMSQLLQNLANDIAVLSSGFKSQGDAKLLNWLTSVDEESRQKAHISKRQPGTGEWFIGSERFQTWCDEPKQTLFCVGIPGAGKTVLSSIVVDHLFQTFRQRSNVGIAYVYFDFKRQSEQDVGTVVACLLKQLAQLLPSIPSEIVDLYDVCQTKKTRPSLDDMLATLKSVVSKFDRAFIVMDALDECQRSSLYRSRLLDAVLKIQEDTGANMLATSRRDQDIIDRFKDCTPWEIYATSDDVKNFVAANLDALRSVLKSKPELREEILTTIPRVVKGMFLLAQLHMDALANQLTPGDVKLALQNLPEGMDETYKRTMERIGSQGKEADEMAKRVLYWLVRAKRVLSTEELQHALAVKTGTRKLDTDFIPSVDVLSSICAGLITMEKDRMGTTSVKLVHFTTHEYLERTQGVWFADADTYMTTCCLTYLMFGFLDEGPCKRRNELETRSWHQSLFKYAGQNWGHHARLAEQQCQDMMLRFLASDGRVRGAMQAIDFPRSRDNFTPSEQKLGVTGLHAAAWFGLEKTTRALLAQKKLVDVKDSDGFTPLVYASRFGNEAIIEILLQAGASISVGDVALHIAAAHGHESTVRLLLQRGLKVDVTSQLGGSRGLDLNLFGISRSGYMPSEGAALAFAVAGGHEGIVRLFLNLGADANMKDSWDRTPLMFACYHGSETIARLLIDHGALADEIDTQSETALVKAALQGHAKLVTIILGQNVQVDKATHYTDESALMVAAGKGHLEVVQLLLRGRANINFQDKHGSTALMNAIKTGKEDVAGYLIDNGANIRTKDDDGASALAHAAARGQMNMVRILLERVQDIESRSEALIYASYYTACHKEATELLLQSGASTSHTVDGQTVLLNSTRTGTVLSIRTLLRHGSDIEFRGPKGRTALMQAAEENRELIIAELIRHGANIAAQDDTGRTGLSVGAAKGHKLVVRRLCFISDVNLADAEGCSPLHYAVRGKSKEAVELLLLSENIDPNLEDTSGHTPLMAAATVGDSDITRLLLEHPDTLVDKVGEYGSTALLCAAKAGNSWIFKQLLAAGAMLQDGFEPFMDKTLVNSVFPCVRLKIGGSWIYVKKKSLSVSDGVGILPERLSRSEIGRRREEQIALMK